MQIHASQMRAPQRSGSSPYSSPHFLNILNPPTFSQPRPYIHPAAPQDFAQYWAVVPATPPAIRQSPLGQLSVLPESIRERIYYWTIGPTFYIDQTKTCRMFHLFPRFLPPICYASKTIYNESRDVIFRTHMFVRNISTLAFISFLDNFFDENGHWSELGYQKIESLELESVHMIPSMHTNRSFHDQRALLLRCSNLRILEVGLYRKVLLETHKAKYRKDLRVMVEFLFFPDVLQLEALVDFTIHVRDRKMDIPPTWEWDWKSQLGETEEWVQHQFRAQNRIVKVTVKPHLHSHSGEPWNYPYYEPGTNLHYANPTLSALSLEKQRLALAQGRNFQNPAPMPNVGYH